jgi:transposase InsO family protein
VKYACIARYRGEFKVRLMCRVLSVSPAGFYASMRRSLSRHALTDQMLSQEIIEAHRISRRTYGSPRVHRELKAKGIAVGEKRVARLMQQGGIKAKHSRRFRVTTDSSHAHPIAPNVLNRQFSPEETQGLNRVWVSDITYVWTNEGWLYLSAILDLCSRFVVGWSMRHTMERSLTLSALQMALARRRPLPGVLHHSDRGAQYASADYRLMLEQNGMECSMSRKGDCWDNAVAESFFATIKRELIDGSRWRTREEARAAIFEYIEVWYNRERRHSSLGYVSPTEYERTILRKAA